MENLKTIIVGLLMGYSIQFMYNNKAIRIHITDYNTDKLFLYIIDKSTRSHFSNISRKVNQKSFDKIKFDNIKNIIFQKNDFILCGKRNILICEEQLSYIRNMINE